MKQQISLNSKKNYPLGLHFLILAIPAILLAIIALPFRHQYTLNEPDLLRMMSALIYGNVSGDKSMVDFHPYGIAFSFGWYQLLYAIAPEGWLNDPDLTTLLINRYGIISGLLCSLICPIYINALYGWKVAIVSAIMFFLSPMLLPVDYSGHPIMAASACLFAAGWLFTIAEDKTLSASWPFLITAFLLLLFGLTLRAEIVLGFPFVWLASAHNISEKQSWLYRYGLRAGILAVAFGGFLILQHQYLNSSGGGTGALSEFIKQFLSISKMAKGLVIFILSLGGATILACCWPLYKGARWQNNEMVVLLFLAMPSFGLFLANPMPARHFFFPVLAVCIAVALLLVRWRQCAKWLLAISIAVAIGNQILIELIHPKIIARSNFVNNYPSFTERRFTPAAPSGAFVLDQPAMIVNEKAERLEAIQLAAQLPERLLVLTDHSFAIIAHTLAKDKLLKPYIGKINDIEYTRLKSPQREIVIIEKYLTWPKDITADILEVQAWQGWPVYVQPSTISPHDKTKIPAEREFKLS